MKNYELVISATLIDQVLARWRIEVSLIPCKQVEWMKVQSVKSILLFLGPYTRAIYVPTLAHFHWTSRSSQEEVD